MLENGSRNFLSFENIPFYQGILDYKLNIK